MTFDENVAFWKAQGLSTRTASVLGRDDIQTLEELRAKASQLVRGIVPDMGVKSKIETLEFLVRNPALPPASAAPEPSEPDFYYNAEAWEFTCSVKEVDLLTEDIEPGDVLELSALAKVPSRWAAHVATSVDDDGDPEESEVVIFGTRAEAEAASKARPYVAAPARTAEDHG